MPATEPGTGPGKGYVATQSVTGTKTDTPIGRTPDVESLDVSGLTLTDDQLKALLTVDPEVWKEEAALIPPDYAKFGDRLPEALWAQHRALLERLENASAKLVAAE